MLPARALGGPGQASDEVNLSYVRQEPIRPTRLPLLGVSAVAKVVLPGLELCPLPSPARQ